MWCSRGSTAWTVIFEADPRFQASCLNRFIYVKAVTSLEQVLQGAEAVRGKVSTVGLAAPDSMLAHVARGISASFAACACVSARASRSTLP